jgi:hypothetical protein
MLRTDTKELLNEAIAFRDLRDWERAREAFAMLHEIEGGTAITRANLALTDAEIFAEYVIANNIAVPPRATYPHLCIGLPCYRRHQKFRQLLAIICHQVAELPEFVTVRVYDNWPGEENQATVAPFLKSFGFLQYKKNFIPIGPDLNYTQIYVNGEGEFSWMIGDDDLLVPGSIAAVLDLVKMHLHTNTTLIYLPTCITNEQTDGIINPSTILPGTPELAHPLDTETAVQLINIELLRMSSCVVRRLPLSADMQQILVGYFVTTLCIALNALGEGQCAVADDVLVIYREGDKDELVEFWPTIRSDFLLRPFAALCESGHVSAAVIDPIFFDCAGLTYEKWRDSRRLESLLRAKENALNETAAAESRVRFLEGLLIDRTPAHGDAPINLLCHHQAFSSRVIDAPEGAFVTWRDATLFVKPPLSGQRTLRLEFSRIPAFGQAYLKGTARALSPEPIRVTIHMRTDMGGLVALGDVLIAAGSTVDWEAAFGNQSGFCDVVLDFVMDGMRSDNISVWCQVGALELHVRPIETVSAAA